MINKIVSRKKTSAIFLAIVLVTGTIAISSLSSSMTNAQAQPDYNDGRDNNYEKSKDSFIKNKIKCINNNINIDGENTGDVNLGNDNKLRSITAAEEGYLSTNSLGDGHYDGYNNNNKVKDFDCTNNNNNNNTEQGGGAQGLIGTNQITSANLYLVRGNIAAVTPTNSAATSIATCDAGDIVFEGGYQTFLADDRAPPVVTYDGPLPAPNLDPTVPLDSAYQVSLHGNNTQFGAFAYCLDNPPLRP